MKILLGLVLPALLLVACAAPAEPRPVALAAPAPATCQLRGVTPETMEAAAKTMYCQRFASECCAPDAPPGCSTGADWWYVKQVYCENLRGDACCSGKLLLPADCEARVRDWYQGSCGGWEGAQHGARPAGLLRARVVEVTEESSNLGGSHVFLEATVEGRTKRLHAGDHGWRTRLRAGAEVTVDAVLLAAPMRWSNPWTAEHEIDGFAVIVSPAGAFDTH
jgi:hypothetical protein